MQRQSHSRLNRWPVTLALACAFFAVPAAAEHSMAQEPNSQEASKQKAEPAPPVGATVVAGEKTVRVLLLGNSYTSGMRPWLVRLFQADPEFGTVMVSKDPGGRQLHEHLGDDRTRQLIRDYPWDAVVLQDQSQTPSGAYLNYGQSRSKRSFADWATMQTRSHDYDKKDNSYSSMDEQFWIGAVGLTREALRHSPAKVYYFVTWARHTDDFKKDNGYLRRFHNSSAAQAARNMSRANYVAYAGVHQAAGKRTELIPVNYAWDAAYFKNKDIRLHQGDNSHANALGSQIAAARIYMSITDRKPADLKFPGGISEADQGIIRQALVDSEKAG